MLPRLAGRRGRARGTPGVGKPGGSDSSAGLAVGGSLHEGQGGLEVSNAGRRVLGQVQEQVPGCRVSVDGALETGVPVRNDGSDQFDVEVILGARGDQAQDHRTQVVDQLVGPRVGAGGGDVVEVDLGVWLGRAALPDRFGGMKVNSREAEGGSRRHRLGRQILFGQGGWEAGGER